MHRNGRTIKLSDLEPNRYTLPARDTKTRPTIVCPDCGRFRTIQRTAIFPHRADDGVTRCPGSGTRVIFDMTSGSWAAALRREAYLIEGPTPSCVISSTVRRATRVKVKPEPAPVVPLHRMAAAR
jgi:hypothetical protein